jgi:phosphatidylserine decarboxylase
VAVAFARIEPGLAASCPPTTRATRQLNESGSTPARCVFRQVVGILARRIVCRIAEGQQIGLGERMGLMKFGSRMDVFLPPDVELQVRVGQTVTAGETILASLRRNDAA